MEIKQTKEHEQQEIKTKPTVEHGQSEEIVPDEKGNIPDHKTAREISPGKDNILKRIWAYVLQNPVGTSGWVVAIVAIIALVSPKVIQVEVKFTSESINTLFQSENTAKFLALEKSLRKVEQDPKASVMNKAVVEAYKLKQVGKIDESIEKWRSIANIAERTDNDLAAGAWFAVGSLYTPEDEKDEDISVHTFDKSIFLPGYLDKPFRLTMSYVGQNVNREVIEKVISFYDQAIRLKSDFSEAYLNRGLAKYALDKYDEAITDYNKVIQLEPDFCGSLQ